jgi:hypothetical protein
MERSDKWVRFIDGWGNVVKDIDVLLVAFVSSRVLHVHLNIFQRMLVIVTAPWRFAHLTTEARHLQWRTSDHRRYSENRLALLDRIVIGVTCDSESRAIARHQRQILIWKNGCQAQTATLCHPQRRHLFLGPWQFPADNHYFIRADPMTR